MKKIIIILSFSLILIPFVKGGFNFIHYNKDVDHAVSTPKANAEKNQENTKQPIFKVQSIKSKISTLNEAPSTTKEKGIIYEVALFSEKEIDTEMLKSLLFEIDSPALNEYLGPIQPLRLASTLDKGYLYSLQFETMYKIYNPEELKFLKDYREFLIKITSDNYKIPIYLSANDSKF
ncbi:hypothetical protein AM500_17725 [Bacillus sp. FJAT-18017]|uniref:hypothetical protein n=1 Tax=Bacillus sp. FJAT-18017 TaxID=1705566 RepID=UPI0006AE67FD|nr:hypothetical protein [Bacillus sp. FJAT-18017]ALC91428.1 hypothetical protein AM500_17725 [Bacillus sp. FJAT-18017]